MSCHGCAEKFGFLKKEYGCPKCGFAYCKKCLRFQTVDPVSKKQLMVCFKCDQSLQIESGKKERVVIMNALHKLESMDDPAKPPITAYRQPARQVRLQELKRGLSVEDQQILERLQSLKEDDSLVSKGQGKRRTSEKIEEEIAERLARLKDEEYRPESENVARNLGKVKPMTEEDIIAKYSAEVEMDSKYEASVVSDIESRLAKLRGDTSAGPSSSNPTRGSRVSDLLDQDEISEEDQVKQIMQRLQEELALEERVGGDSCHDMEVDNQPSSTQDQLSASDDDDIDVDELCGICSDKRATLQCDECDGDVFCKGCFQELHRELGEIHKAKLFKKK